MPIYTLAEIPVKTYDNIIENLESRKSLINKNKILEKKVFIQSGIIQKIPSLKEENKRLKKLLNSSNPTKNSKILIAELIKVNLSPFSNKVVLNKGSKSNIYVGSTCN